MSYETIESHARLIESLAATMRNNMWATDIESRCYIMQEEIRKILSIAAKRHAGER